MNVEPRAVLADLDSDDITLGRGTIQIVSLSKKSVKMSSTNPQGGGDSPARRLNAVDIVEARDRTVGREVSMMRRARRKRRVAHLIYHDLG